MENVEKRVIETLSLCASKTLFEICNAISDAPTIELCNEVQQALNAFAAYDLVIVSEDSVEYEGGLIAIEGKLMINPVYRLSSLAITDFCGLEDYKIKAKLRKEIKH